MPVWIRVVLVKWGEGYRFISGDVPVSPVFNNRRQARGWLKSNGSRYILDRSNVIPL